MQIMLFIFSTIGLTHIVVDGKIFEPIRNIAHRVLPNFLSYLFSCYVCSGFWIGMFCGWACFTKINEWQILMAGFSSSFLANFAAMVFNLIESHTTFNMPQDTK